MARDLRSRLVEDILTYQNNVLTHVIEIERSTASKELYTAQLERAKKMLAALDGEANEYSHLVTQPKTLHPPMRWWQVGQPGYVQVNPDPPPRPKGDKCPPPSFTPQNHSRVTSLDSPRVAR